MRLLLLLLLPLFAYASEQSAITDAYLIETERQVEELEWKKDNNQATPKDLFILDHLKQRLESMTERGATLMGFSATVAGRLTQPTEIKSTSLNSQVYFYTEIINMPGAHVAHVWTSNGRQVYAEEFEVTGDNTRVWSARSVHFPNDLVVQVYLDGEMIGSKTLTVR